MGIFVGLVDLYITGVTSVASGNAQMVMTKGGHCVFRSVVRQSQTCE